MRARQAQAQVLLRRRCAVQEQRRDADLEPKTLVSCGDGEAKHGGSADIPSDVPGALTPTRAAVGIAHHERLLDAHDPALRCLSMARRRRRGDDVEPATVCSLDSMRVGNLRSCSSGSPTSETLSIVPDLTLGAAWAGPSTRGRSDGADRHDDQQERRVRTGPPTTRSTT